MPDEPIVLLVGIPVKNRAFDSPANLTHHSDARPGHMRPRLDQTTIANVAGPLDDRPRSNTHIVPDVDRPLLCIQHRAGFDLRPAAYMDGMVIYQMRPTMNLPREIEL